jgi:hypothetical protein
MNQGFTRDEAPDRAGIFLGISKGWSSEMGRGYLLVSHPLPLDLWISDLREISDLIFSDLIYGAQ